jgi:hypothetical protein
VKGAGVAIALRGDDPQAGTAWAEAFATTQGRMSISGSRDWLQYSVSLQDLDAAIGTITAFVILLPGTTGTAYVDDVTVTSSVAAPQLALSNGGFEAGLQAPDNWWTGGTEPGFTFRWLSTGAQEGRRAVSITREHETTGFAFWAQTLRASAFVNGPVTLRAWLRTELVGQGVSIAVRGDDTQRPAGSAESFATSQYVKDITGSNGWTEWTVTLSNLPAGMQSLTIYLILLPNTTGTVDFDAVTLTR